ncbi:MAG: ice-binding family protein [Kofleriaceae bacterium]
MACGDDAGTGDAIDAPTASPPTVVARSPADAATDVARNLSVSATFSEVMDPATLTAATFTLTVGAPAVPVAGTVIYRDLTAVFWPTAHLPSGGTFTATITTGATSAAGVGLAAASSWTFTTGTTLAPGLPVALGTAGGYALLAKSGISTVPTSAVTGDLGVSPVAASSITGFSLTADASNVFATSPQVTGRVYAADYAPPTPANLTTAIGDMGLAFTEAAGRAPDVSELGAGDVGGQTLAPGVYKWGTGLLIPTDVTLTGTATDVWIFQIAQDLTVKSGARVTLAGGASPAHVFWQVSGSVELGTTAHLEGVVLGQTSITLRTGATVNGRLLAQTAIAIDGATVVAPAP